MIDRPLAWFRRLTLAQKFLVSFGSLLFLLGLSLAAILFYLSKINSYVERHNRITVPAVEVADRRQCAADRASDEPCGDFS